MGEIQGSLVAVSVNCCVPFLFSFACNLLHAGGAFGFDYFLFTLQGREKERKTLLRRCSKLQKSSNLWMYIVSNAAGDCTVAALWIKP